MRFISEFEGDDDSRYVNGIRKIHQEENLGHEIANVFGWDERGVTTLAKDSPIKHIYKLEIEAFPMEKWIEFKQKLFSNTDGTDGTIPATLILEMIKDLEFYSNNKQAVDKLTTPK